MIDEQFDRDCVAAVNRRRLLWAFLPFESALSTLAQARRMLDPLEKTDPLAEAELREQWNVAKENIEPIEDLKDPDIRPIPDDSKIREHIESLTDMAFFQNTYGELTVDADFGMVPLEKIIALQGSVVTTAHEDISTIAEDSLALIQYAFPTEREQGYFTQSIQTENNELLGLQLTSRAPNVSVQNISMHEGERPMERQVVFTIRAPPNLVNCTIYEDRIYLNNGYHRAFQLLEAGETHIPAILRESSTFPSSTGDLPEDIVLSERPPTIPDFATEAATTFRLPATNELIRITAESTKVFR